MASQPLAASQSAGEMRPSRQPALPADLAEEIEKLVQDAGAAPGAKKDDEEPTGRVFYEGWLTKEGRRIKSWKRRWFVLRGLTLAYYADPQTAKPKGIINLAVTAVQPCLSRKDVKNCMELITEGRKLYFQADTMDVAQAWVLALNKIISCINYMKKTRMLRGKVDPRVMEFFLNESCPELVLAGSPLSLEALVALELPLRYHTHIRSLLFDHCGLGDIEATLVGTALASNRTLETVDLSYNEIGPDGARGLAQGILSNGSLTALLLQGNRIGAGAADLASSLWNHRILTALDLASNGIGDTEVLALVAALSATTTEGGGAPMAFPVLSLSDNAISDAGAHALASLVAANPSVQVLDLYIPPPNNNNCDNTNTILL